MATPPLGFHFWCQPPPTLRPPGLLHILHSVANRQSHRSRNPWARLRLADAAVTGLSTSSPLPAPACPPHLPCPGPKPHRPTQGPALNTAILRSSFFRMAFLQKGRWVISWSDEFGKHWVRYKFNGYTLLQNFNVLSRQRLLNPLFLTQI